jgi:hypothetical protein
LLLRGERVWDTREAAGALVHVPVAVQDVRGKKMEKLKEELAKAFGICTFTVRVNR